MHPSGGSGLNRDGESPGRRRVTLAVLVGRGLAVEDGDERAVTEGNLHAEGVAHHSPARVAAQRRTLGDQMEIARTLKGYHNRCADGAGRR